MYVLLEKGSGDSLEITRRGGGFLPRWSFTASMYMICGTASLALLFAIKLNLIGTGVQTCNAAVFASAGYPKYDANNDIPRV